MLKRIKSEDEFGSLESRISKFKRFLRKSIAAASMFALASFGGYISNSYAQEGKCPICGGDTCPDCSGCKACGTCTCG